MVFQELLYAKAKDSRYVIKHATYDDSYRRIVAYLIAVIQRGAVFYERNGRLIRTDLQCGYQRVIYVVASVCQ